MKRKNLEKAIIMSLLAASISVPVWAETIYGNIWGGNINQGSTDGSLTIITPIDPDDPSKTKDGIGFNGTVDIENGDLNITATSNGISSGWVKDATVNIFAGDITINSEQNGIFTTWGDGLGDLFKGYSGHVNIGSSDRRVDSLYIDAGGQGIDNKWGNVNIYGSKDSTISIKTDSTGGEMEN